MKAVLKAIRLAGIASIAFLSLLGLVSRTAAAQSTKVEGMIKSRSGPDMILSTKQDPNFIVYLVVFHRGGAWTSATAAGRTLHFRHERCDHFTSVRGSIMVEPHSSRCLGAHHCYIDRPQFLDRLSGPSDRLAGASDHAGGGIHFLTSDLDSQREGSIRVRPQSPISVSQSLGSQVR